VRTSYIKIIQAFAFNIIASVGQTGIRGMTTNPALYFEIDQITNGKKRQPMDPSNILP